MKNSVADRANAQVSCAGQFIANNMGDFLENGGQWMHIDMA
jgi:probable aminopeptidase NPEPL1